MTRRRVAVFALVAVLSVFYQDRGWAHAGPRLSDPLEGATLGDTPTLVRLYLSEQPEPSLSSIRVVDTAGGAYQIGRAQSVPGDPLSLAVRVRPLPTGVYTVNWRIVSAVDGHATAGAYAFGVRATPAAAASTASPAASSIEVLARFILLVGLVAVLGAAGAGVARFGGTRDLVFGAGGWLVAAAGLTLLAEAQRRTAAASFADLLHTPIGRALVLRGIALGAAGVALVGVRLASPRFRRAAMAVLAVAALAVIAVHAANGHAAAGGRWPPGATVAAQWVHVAAIGIWVGGLAALLLSARGAAPAVTFAAARRFSGIAAVSLVLVATTGAVLTTGALSSWSELRSTAYGWTVLAKIALMVLVSGLGAINRWRGVPATPTRPALLFRVGGLELACMAGALAAAALLATLPTPAGGAGSGLSVSGSDFGTTVRVRLTTPSDQPGPNRFVVAPTDYDSNRPLRASRVSLRFTPLDDPGIESTTLSLAPGQDDTFVGSGANLAFDGRWRVSVLIERGAGTVAVPLDVETRSAPQFVSLEHNPGQDPEYTVEVRRGLGSIRISPRPERPGPTEVYVTCFDTIGDIRPVDDLIVTAGTASTPVRQQAVRRLDDGRFVAGMTLERGRNRITVIARALDGTRLRASLSLDLPAR